MKLRPLFLSPLLAAALHRACASALAETLRTITIFSINDFHGNLQSISLCLTCFRVCRTGKAVNGAAGGYAYLATKLKERRAAVGDSILVGAGDLMGASPMGSALLKDEPVIEALNRMT
jgi:5'-nucleotidase